MAEASSLKALWLALAWGASTLGFAWLALAMEPHWQQVRGTAPCPPRTVRALRVLGSVALAASLWACLRADHASMAALVWVLMLAAGALGVALTLAWRARWLAPLVAWVPSAASH
jgi:hypothetical protein